MAGRSLFGPVFAFESLTIPRRWQLFAGRALFISALLVVMSLLWWPLDRLDEQVGLQQLAEIGQEFFRSLLYVQMAVVLLTAPAATVGAICVDKVRGTLFHVFTTDLTDREIVLGKLGPRLLSIISLIACSAPVLSIGGLLGGIPYEAIVALFLVSLGVAALGCSLGLLFSAWARKPSRALIAAYLVLGLWTLVAPAYIDFDRSSPGSVSPEVLRFLRLTNPFLAPRALLDQPGRVSLLAPLALMLGLSGLSAAIVGWVVCSLRKVVIRQADRRARPKKIGAPGKLVMLLPAPPLDSNPILWREWHRKRRTLWVGRAWTVYAVLALLASGTAIFAYFDNPSGIGPDTLAGAINGLNVAIGLLLLMISATTALAEERDRGSLDVVLTTPLPSRTILWGKWWGTFAMVPRMAILPIWVGAALAMVTGDLGAFLLMVGMILACSASVVSLGLLLATWVPRLSRAILLGVLLYVLGSIGLIFIHGLYSSQATRSSNFTSQAVWQISGPSSVVRVQAGRGRFSGGTVVWSPAGRRQDGPPDVDWLLLAGPYHGIAETTRWAGRRPRAMEQLRLAGPGAEDLPGRRGRGAGSRRLLDRGPPRCLDPLPVRDPDDVRPLPRPGPLPKAEPPPDDMRRPGRTSRIRRSRPELRRLGQSPVVPAVATSMIASSVHSETGLAGLRTPRLITAIRSQTPRSSGRYELTIRTAFPRPANSPIIR